MPNRDFLVDHRTAGQRLLAWSVPVKTGHLVNLSACNVTKLHFQANICKAFADDKSNTIVET